MRTFILNILIDPTYDSPSPRSEMKFLTTKESLMGKRIFPLLMFIVLFVALDCYAGGKYRVGQDQRGTYIQTENDGGWYIAKRDLKDFRIGQSGNYSIGKDQDGTFLLIGKNRKYFLDIEAKEKQDIEAAVANKEYERAMESLRQKESQRKIDEMRLKEEKNKEQARLQQEKNPKVEHYHSLEESDEVRHRPPIPSWLKIERNYVPVATRTYFQHY
jgi:hypothetical protein